VCKVWPSTDITLQYTLAADGEIICSQLWCVYDVLIPPLQTHIIGSRQLPSAVCLAWHAEEAPKSNWIGKSIHSFLVRLYVYTHTHSLSVGSLSICLSVSIPPCRAALKELLESPAICVGRMLRRFELRSTDVTREQFRPKYHQTERILCEVDCRPLGRHVVLMLALQVRRHSIILLLDLSRNRMSCKTW